MNLNQNLATQTGWRKGWEIRMLSGLKYGNEVYINPRKETSVGMSCGDGIFIMIVATFISVWCEFDFSILL